MALAFIQPLRIALGAHWDKFLAQYTIRYQPKVGPPVTVKLWSEGVFNGTPIIILPRAAIPKLRRAGVLVEPTFPDHPADFPAGQIALSNNQQAVIAKILSVFTPQRAVEGTATAILDMPPGRGKTITAAAIAAAIGQRCLFVVHRVELANQAQTDFKKYFGDNAAPIETIVVNSALKKPREWFLQFGFVIIDEVHAYCSDKRRGLLRLASTRYMLGMSGTVGHKVTGMDKVYIAELAVDGVIKARELPEWIADEVEFNVTARVVKYYGADEFTQTLTHESTGKLFTPYMYEMFANDPRRLQCIVDEVLQLYAANHHIFVFCETRDYVAKIVAALGPIAVSPLIGGTKNTEEVRAAARIIVTTYGYSSEGLSISRMTAMVLATPRRSNHRQITARIMRRDGDRAIRRIIVDIVDARTALYSQYYARRAVYMELGCEFETVKVITPPHT